MIMLRAFIRCQRGAAASELALLIPLLTVMMFGAIEIAYYFYNEHQVIKGVRDGARYASRQSFAALNCSGSVAEGLKTNIQEVTRTGRVSGGSTRVPGWVNDDIAVSISCPGTAVTTGIYSTESNAPTVTVSTTVKYKSLFAGVGILTDRYNMRASHQAPVMGI